MEDEESTQRKLRPTAADISLCLLFSISLVTVTSVCLAIAILLNPSFKPGGVVLPTKCPTVNPNATAVPCVTPSGGPAGNTTQATKIVVTPTT